MRGEPASSDVLRAGDRVLVGDRLVPVTAEFLADYAPGDRVVGVPGGQLRRIPAAVSSDVSGAVGRAVDAFRALAGCADEQVTAFFATAAERLADDAVMAAVIAANEADVARAAAAGRSTTRLALTPSMRASMVEGLEMWRDLPAGREARISNIEHDGWRVEEWRAPLGVIGFVFEGRPNVFADATGVLRTGNTVVFRIGRDALGTARELMRAVVGPALVAAGLPADAAVLIDSPEHAAGWALFSDPRLSLAVARGSGGAVAELGAIARSAGVPVSLHGTGGAWMIVGDCDPDRLALVVEHSLDRKVCNSLNTVCVRAESAARDIAAVREGARRAAQRRGCESRFHLVGEAAAHFEDVAPIVDVTRAPGPAREPQWTVAGEDDLGEEHEWEVNPELTIIVVRDTDHAVDLFNIHSPRFVVSVCSDAQADHDAVWSRADAPFVGDGFTRWVDGQWALLRPELGLSNWQNGRLLGRGGILSGDSAFTVRLRAHQSDPHLHR